jgi:hypothetical protein
MTTIETLREVLGWCAVINFGALLFLHFILWAAHDRVHRLFGIWFKLSRENFDKANYTCITFFKIIFLVFNLVPYVALCIVG